MSTTRRRRTLLAILGFAAAAHGQTESVEVFVDDPRPLHEAKRLPALVKRETPTGGVSVLRARAERERYRALNPICCWQEPPYCNFNCAHSPLVFPQLLRPYRT